MEATAPELASFYFLDALFGVIFGIADLASQAPNESCKLSAELLHLFYHRY